VAWLADLLLAFSFDPDFAHHLGPLFLQAVARSHKSWLFGIREHRELLQGL
jgi:hypothetical protein